MAQALRLDCIVRCAECQTLIAGWIALNAQLALVDTGGFLLAGSSRLSVLCDDCCRKQGLNRLPLIHVADLTGNVLRDALAEILARRSLTPSQPEGA